MIQTPTTNPKDRIGLTKLPLHYIPLPALIQSALAHLDGALKYGRYNWRRESVAATIYIDAALRHLQKWASGEESDRDSGVHHLGHVIACCNILIDAQSCGNLIDDRDHCPETAKLLDASREEVLRLLKKHGREIPNTAVVDDNAPGN